MILQCTTLRRVVAADLPQLRSAYSLQAPHVGRAAVAMWRVHVAGQAGIPCQRALPGKVVHAGPAPVPALQVARKRLSPPALSKLSRCSSTVQTQADGEV